MKKPLLLFLLIILSYSLFFILVIQKNFNLNSIFSYSICEAPVAYKIGIIDTRFNITEAQLIKLSTQASDIWNKSYATTLFVYDPLATLSIDMVFDDRQSLNNQINQLKTELNNNQKSLKPQEAKYQQQAANFKKRLSVLNEEIANWNSRGGAPEDVYKKLQQERDDLIREAEILNETANNLNLSADNFNAQVSNLNQKVQTFNQELTVKPEEGKYLPVENKIEIYFNNNEVELVHTIAHELGHARGLDHNQNPKSIMYPNTTQEIKVSEDDIKALNTLCAEQTMWQFIKDRLNQQINSQVK